MKCQICFASLSRGAKYCETCGATFEPEVKVIKEVKEPTKLKKINGKWCNCLAERLIAVFLDGLIISALAKVLQSSFMDVQTFAQALEGLWGKIGEHAPFYIVVMVLYYSLMEGSRLQATLGKRVCGIRVTDIYGRRLSPLQAFMRGLSRILSVASQIGYLFALFTERERALHDLLAGSVVQNGPAISEE